MVRKSTRTSADLTVESVPANSLARRVKNPKPMARATIGPQTMPADTQMQKSITKNILILSPYANL